MKGNEKALFTLTASECEAQVQSLVAEAKATHPIKCAVAASLFLAEAAVQRISINALKRVDIYGQCNWPEFLALPQETVEFVENLNNYMFDGNPARIDLVLWDAAGYVHGWFLNDAGQPDIARGSCADVVLKVSTALTQLATCETEWRPLLEKYASTLATLFIQSREKAELIALERVRSQGWWARRLRPTSLERELVSLGFVQRDN
jgi:hypothetical protein